MFYFALLHGEAAVVDNIDRPFIESRTWSLNARGDIVSSYEGRTFLLRREIAWRAGYLEELHDVVMHYNGDRLDCTRDNLRVVTRKKMMKLTGAIKFDSLRIDKEEHALYLHNGSKVLIDAKDFPIVEHYRWQETSEGFVVRSEEMTGKRFYKNANGNVLLHHLIAERFAGKLHPHQRVRHKNGNKLDNRRRNLLVIAPGIRKKKNGKYTVYIYYEHNHTFYGGTYTAWEDAAYCYNVAATRFFGAAAYQHTLPLHYIPDFSPEPRIFQFLLKIQ